MDARRRRIAALAPILVPAAALATAATVTGAAVATSAAVDLPAGLTAPFLDVVPRTEVEAGRIATVTAPTTDFSEPEPFEANPGGATTVPVRTDADAFSLSSANMSFERELDFKIGNGLFRKLWVSSPSSTQASDGLGPLYNARACQLCHLKDGRGHPPSEPGENPVSMFLRISVPAPPDAAMSEIEAFLDTLGDTTPRTRPDPTYGNQIQGYATPGQAAEGRMTVTYEEVPVALSGGETASLRAPTYAVADLGYGPLADDAMLSPRVAPQMIGLGLLEAVPAAEILAGADPADADGDGISGKAQIVWSAEFDRPMLGRFGWKAGAPTVRHQSASAFSGDIGMSTPIVEAPWGECTEAETLCRSAPHGAGGGHEIDADSLELVTFYSRNLAVPARRDLSVPEVLRGKEVFYETGCIACHRPKYVTARLEDQPEQSFQLIWPYTDMLLHDMGEGLADHRPEGRATGREWRTAPLWGIGLTEQVSGEATFLHDGRARSLLEAILWHGGEAAAAKARVMAMPPVDRHALIRFLESL